MDRTAFLSDIGRSLILGCDPFVRWPPSEITADAWTLLEEHRLIEALLPYLGAGAPPAARVTVERAQARRDARSRQVERITAILAELNERGVGYVVCKGPSLSSHLYGDPIFRSYADIDVLVEIGRVAEIHEYLTALGYRQSVLFEDEVDEIHSSLPFAVPKANLRVLTNYKTDDLDLPELEIHIALPSKVGAPWTLLIRSEVIDIANRNLRILDREAVFAHLIADKLKDLDAGWGFYARDLVEIARLAELDGHTRGSPRYPRVALTDHEAMEALFLMIARVFHLPSPGVSAHAPETFYGRFLSSLTVETLLAAGEPQSRDLARLTIGRQRAKAVIAMQRHRPPLACEHSLALEGGGEAHVGIRRDNADVRFVVRIAASALEYLGWFSVEFRFLGNLAGSLQEIAFRLNWDTDHLHTTFAQDFRSGGRSSFNPYEAITQVETRGDQVELSFMLPLNSLPTIDWIGVDYLVADANIRREFCKHPTEKTRRKVVKIGACENLIIAA